MLTAVSTIVLGIIALGLVFRKRPEVHIPLMSFAFVMDLGLLLYIEFSRQAIETLNKDIHAPVHNGLLLFHVSVSLLTLLLYIALIATGIQLFKGTPARRTIHKGCAFLFITCRLLNYITSFFMPA